MLSRSMFNLVGGPSQGQRCSLPHVRASSCPAGESPSLSLSSSEGAKVKLLEEEQLQKHYGGWTPEQLDVVGSLLHRPPRPLPSNRLDPPAPRFPSKYRLVGFPSRRSRSPAAVPSLPHPAKDKRFLCDLAVQISRLHDEDNVSELLNPCQHRLRHGSLSATIRKLGCLGMPHRAYELFQWQQDFPHLWPDDRTLCATIEVLAKAQMEEKAWGLLRAYGRTSIMAFEALARGLISECLLDRAFLVKKEAENCGLLLDQGLYAELVLLASRLNRTQEVKALVRELGTFSDLRLSLVHCTSLMAACRKVGSYDAVTCLFQWWKQAGLLPNNVMYEIVMTSLSSAGKHREALAIYWEMEESACAPDLRTFKALFEICEELGNSSKALRLWAKMRDLGITATYDIYENLIKVCCKDGRLGKARDFMEAMRKEGLPTEALAEHFG